MGIANEKISAAEEQIRVNAEKAREDIDILKDKIVATEKEWRDKKDEAVKLKDEEIKGIEKEHKAEMVKAHEEREA